MNVRFPLDPVLWRHFFKRLRQFQLSYLVICFLGLVLAALHMVPPKLMGLAVDEVSRESFVMSKIILLMLIWGAASLGIEALHGLQIMLASRTGERVLSRWREDLFAHLQNLSMSFYDRNQIGRLLACFGDDLNSLRSLCIWGCNTVTSNLGLLLFSAFMIYTVDHKLLWATVWLAPAMTLVNFIYGQRVSRAWSDVREQASLVGANQAENIMGLRVVTAFNRQDQNLSSFNELQEASTLSHLRASRINGVFSPWLQWLRFTGQAVILIYGGYRVTTGDLLPGQLVSVSLYWEWFAMPATNFGSFMNELLVGSTALHRVVSVMTEKPALTDKLSARAVPRVAGRVEFENVDFSYLPDRPVLRNVSFAIPAGSTVALVGATGSGKTTILSLLARFYEVSSGCILLDGIDIRELTLESLHQQTAMVLQKNFLFSGTVMDNLKFSNPDVSDEDVFFAAKQLGSHEIIRRLEHGYNTWVGDQGTSLSLGERQLICFTRALVASPQLLLLDEATSALDPASDRRVQNALRKLAQGRTTFIVTHRLSSAEQADFILVLDHGRIVETGNHRGLLAQGGFYSELFSNSIRNFSGKIRYEDVNPPQSM